MGLGPVAAFLAIAVYLFVQYQGIRIFGKLIGKENAHDWVGWERFAFYLWIVCMVPFGWWVYTVFE
jgi:hypothetical protein